MPQQRNELIDRTIAALLWIAAFAFAVGVFLSATLLLRSLPRTPLIAVGRVTVERASKVRDYAAAALFFVIVAPATLAFHRVGRWRNDELRRALAFRRVADRDWQDVISFLFVTPFFLAPFLFLTTQKWGWPILIPIAAAELVPRALITYESTAWMRRLFRRPMLPFHTLIAVEALAWVLFRYIVLGKRIAHIPTLFLEITFVAFVVIIFWGAFLLIARLAAFTLTITADVALQRIAIAALPLAILPLLAILLAPAAAAICTVMSLLGAAMVVALAGSEAADATTTRKATVFVVIPVLLYCLSYVSTAATAQSIDLFHRGESLGPASDYLRGKIPYRDVFILHGLMQDGLLDAWLIDLFGPRDAIVLDRPALLGSFAAPALWLLGIAIFESVPIAALVMLLGAVTTVDNERAFFEIAVVALFMAALRRGSGALVMTCGVVAAVSLFYSLDIGLYCIGGSLLALALLRRLRWITSLVIGIAIGAAPFLVYLAARGALSAFFSLSFVSIPRIIDAVWSLPFPDLTSTFRDNLNLHTISDFFLYERFRFVLNPLVIGIAIVCIVQRAIAGRREWLDVALIALVCFAVLTQRSALGRADFPHQYFSAFLIAPIIVILFVFVTRAPRVLIVIGGMLLFPILAVSLWLPDLLNGRIDDMTRYTGRVNRWEFVDPVAAETRRRIDGVRYLVDQLSHAGQPIFDFSNQPALYFFCDRPNPTRFYQVPVMSPREFQREAILDLERSRPPVVIRRSPQDFDQFDGVDNSIRAQAVAAYLDDHYTYYATTYGVEVWRRQATAAKGSVDGYLRQIRVPSLKELGVIGSRARVVFPWMTSGRGGSGTVWRSDLTLHNPLNVPMWLRLRYIAGDTRVDRQVVLAARRSIRWDDVVRLLFGAPETGGVVWIEYRGDRAPVARAQTYDVAHDRGGSIVEPLSISDSATAGTPRDQLSILGFSERHNLINLGVVNVGQVPLTFQMTLAGPGGTKIGQSVQETVNESEAFVVTDAERALGVKLDSTMTANVKVMAGSAVAFANSIEANGDAQFLAGVPSSQR